MTALYPLLKREAREQRWLVLTLATLGCALLAAFHSFELNWHPYAWTIDAHGPALVYSIVGAGLLITEALTRDSQHDAGERLGTLPLGRRALVGAKLLWLAAAGAALAACAHGFEAGWIEVVGSKLAAVPNRQVAGAEFPLGLYLPVWSAWAVACGLVLRSWLLAAVALAGCVALSISLWPWPLEQPAVLPGWLVAAATGLVPLGLAWAHFRPGWLLPREAPVSALRCSLIGLMIFGGIGLVQVQGRSYRSLPVPGQVHMWAQSLSDDGKQLCLQAHSAFPLLGGKPGDAWASWVIDTNDGTLLLNGWERRFYHHSFTEGVRELMSVSLLDRGNQISLVDPYTGAEDSLASSLHDLFNRHRWEARTVDDERLVVTVPWQGIRLEVPWKGSHYTGPEVGVLYSLQEGLLQRHEVLEGKTRTLAQLPEAPGKWQDWRLKVGPTGTVLLLSTWKGKRLYLDAFSGAEIAAAPDGWHESWTGGPAPFAVARPVLTEEEYDKQVPRSLEACWLGPEGARRVAHPEEGEIISSAAGRIFLVGGPNILELDPRGTVLGSIVVAD